MAKENYKFNTNDTGLAQFNGQTVSILRQMTAKLDNIDEFDLPKMYKIKTKNGIILEAFEDELIKMEEINL